jgi:hypothetical protein
VPIFKDLGNLGVYDSFSYDRHFKVRLPAELANKLLAFDIRTIVSNPLLITVTFHQGVYHIVQ